MPPTSAGHLELSIVLPCLNEARTLADCIREVQQSFAENAIGGEIIVADNRSTDDSRSIATELGAIVVDVPRRGYGHALLAGFDRARGDYIILGDCDGSYDFSDIGLFLDRLRAGFSFVIGDRFKGGIEPGAMPWLHRYVGNPVLSGCGRLLFRTPIRDFHCGMRGIHRSILPSLSLRCGGMELASEMVIRATQQKLLIAEIPTRLRRDGRSRRSHLRTWRDGWRHLSLMATLARSRG